MPTGTLSVRLLSCCTGIYQGDFLKDFTLLNQLATRSQLDRKLVLVMTAKLHHLYRAVRHSAPAIMRHMPATLFWFVPAKESCTPHHELTKGQWAMFSKSPCFGRREALFMLWTVFLTGASGPWTGRSTLQLELWTASMTPEGALSLLSLRMREQEAWTVPFGSQGDKRPSSCLHAQSGSYWKCSSRTATSGKRNALSRILM